MKFKLEISIDNSAFEENPDELASILDELAAKAEDGCLDESESIRDSNGNTIGHYAMIKD